MSRHGLTATRQHAHDASMSLADAFAQFNSPDGVELAHWPSANSSPRFGSRLTLTSRSVRYGQSTYPLQGMHVSVDTAGNVAMRPTLTRWLVAGPLALAWQKKVDKREMYLTFEGPTCGFVVKVDPDFAYTARQFAVDVNTAARALDGPAAAGETGSVPSKL